MRSRLICIVVLASMAAVPTWAASKSASKSRPKAAGRPVPKLIQSCDAHKFETVVNSMVEGQVHQSKVRLCGVEGQSDAQWIETLRDAIKKLDANTQMPAPQREQIVTAIKSEIARLMIGASPVVPRRARTGTAAPEEPLSRDYATLPPLPPPPAAPPAPTGSDGAEVPTVAGARENSIATVQKDFAQVPPMPRSPSVAAPPSRALVAAVAPRLNFGCDTPGDLAADAPCAEFERETTVSIHAGEDVPAGTRLQFVRNDRPQADVSLDGLRRGAVLRLALPSKVCSGFASGKLELKIVHDEGNGLSQPLSTLGPYSLRC